MSAENPSHNHRIMRGESLYIWQREDWPNWRYSLTTLAEPLAAVSRAQGLQLGRLADVGLALRDQASLAVLTEMWSRPAPSKPRCWTWPRCVRPLHVGWVEVTALAPVDRHAEDVVEMVLDATANAVQLLTA